MHTLPLPRVKEDVIDGMRFLAARTKTKDVVCIKGSVYGGKNHVSFEKRAVAWLLEDLLDAGTKKRTKGELRETLASLGATLSFSCRGDRLYFDASCLPEDVDQILALIVECLGESVFPVAEVALSKKRAIAHQHENKTETHWMAERTLEQILYEKNHPNYGFLPEEAIKSITRVTRADIVALYKKIGSSGLVFAIGGDIDESKTLQSAQRHFAKLRKGTLGPVPLPSPRRQPSKEVLVSIPDKANIDMLLAVRTLIRFDDPKFLSLKVLLSLLGGGGVSTGHLMRTVRERDGLTYGIRSYTCDFDEGADGHFTVWATFAPKVFAQGLATTRKEIAAFFATGLTPKLLAAKKEEMLGKYLIGLSTTSGLVFTIFDNAIEGRNISYLREYPQLLEKLTLKELKETRALIPLKELSLSAAGTFEK